MKKLYFLLLTLLISSVSFGQVIITEIADPNGSGVSGSEARFVELYVVGPSSVDFTGWELIRYTNAGTTISTNTVDLSSLTTLAVGSYALIAANGTSFQTTYGIAADISAGTGGPADSNGDDKIGIRDNMGVVVDIFGTPGVDSNNANNAMNFEDGRTERVAAVTGPNATWDAAEWDTDNDQGFGGGAQTAPGAYDPGAWIGTATGPLVTVGSSVSGLDYFEGSGPSAEGTFTVSGINLTEGISVDVASPAFEVSLTSGSGFGAGVTVPQTGGTAAATTVYVRLASMLPAAAYAEDVTASSTGATSQTVAVSGTVTPADPQITILGSIDALNYTFGNGPSNEDTFGLEGLFLTDDITVMAPTNFEVSLTMGAGYASSVTVAQAGGTVATTDIYVRLQAGLAVGPYSGDVTVSTPGVTDELVASAGNVFGPATNAMVLTAAYDGPLSGGVPKGVEIYVIEDIADLSLFGLGSAGNGGGTDGQEFTFPAVTVTAGTYLYVSSEAPGFTSFFGFAPDYTTGAMGINGDDAIELFENGQVIDTFGTIDCDPNAGGSPCPEWEHTDSWAYRVSDTGPDGGTFVLANWTFPGPDALDGETTNATAATPVPIGTYTTTLSNEQFNSATFTMYPNPTNTGNVTISSKTNETITVSGFDILGKQVINNTTLNNNTLNVSNLKAGIYILRITQNNASVTKKLVIK